MKTIANIGTNIGTGTFALPGFHTDDGGWHVCKVSRTFGRIIIFRVALCLG
ncbi:hypothetical protein [Photobacterium galatheae]|uniref:hypothetical protein n=1 Tax=Photobacterium galatheae TaxID=1654360 RepID=UPI001377E436|nr:hypothetical protein [Photobacterium galatheae]MCM0147059.1 hypothetical protein [Photobacterium galatheae]